MISSMAGQPAKVAYHVMIACTFPKQERKTVTKKMTVALTNRCNLPCCRCFTGRQRGRADLPLAVLQQILVEAKPLGVEEICFTGGDPMLYRYLGLAVRLTSAAGYRFALMTNGWSFAQTYAHFLPYRAHLAAITFSLAGASADSHDRVQGQGSYQRVLQAMHICAQHELPFTVLMTITAYNRHELAQVAHLAHRLGSRALRFGYLPPSSFVLERDIDLAPQEYKMVEAEVYGLGQQLPLPITMTPRHHTFALSLYAALQLAALHIDCYGNLTDGYHFTKHDTLAGSSAATGILPGAVPALPWATAYQPAREENSPFRQRAYVSDGC